MSDLDAAPAAAAVTAAAAAIAAAIAAALCHCHSGGFARQGLDIISELVAVGENEFVKMRPDTRVSLASVFDQYQKQLRWQKLMDYDDLLHHSLDLVHSHPEVSSHCPKKSRDLAV